MSKKYAVIEGYGKLVVPVSMLEKIASECYLGRTEYSEGKDILVDAVPIGRVELIDASDVESAKAQSKLQS
jgi:hypothetical protein